MITVHNAKVKAWPRLISVVDAWLIRQSKAVISCTVELIAVACYWHRRRYPWPCPSCSPEQAFEDVVRSPRSFTDRNSTFGVRLILKNRKEIMKLSIAFDRAESNINVWVSTCNKDCVYGQTRQCDGLYIRALFYLFIWDFAYKTLWACTFCDSGLLSCCRPIGLRTYTHKYTHTQTHTLVLRLSST